MIFDYKLTKQVSMSTKTNTNISQGLSGMLSAFGNQLEDSMTNALLGLCDDLGIERDAFNTAWNSKYTATTGITLGSAEAKKEVQKPSLAMKSKGGKKAPTAYHLYIKAWRESRDQGSDDRDFKQVRSDWASLSADDKKKWAANREEVSDNESVTSEKSEQMVDQDSQSDKDEAASQTTEPATRDQTTDKDSDDKDVPSINGKALIAANWKVGELKGELKSRGLPVSGIKKVLISRLIEAESGNSDGEEQVDNGSDSSSDSSSSDSDSDSDSEDEHDDEDKDKKAIENVLAQITDEIADIDAAVNEDDDDQLEEEED